MNNYQVDTNVILRFLLSDDERQSPIARSYFVENNNRLFITTVAFCEVVWVMKKRSKIPNDKIALFLNSLVANERIIYNQTEFEQGMKFLVAGGDFADGVIAYNAQNLPKYNGKNTDQVTLLTFDQNASKVATKFNIPNRLL